MTDNELRADRALAALEYYIAIKGEVFENSSSEIVDLVTDLLHLTARNAKGDDPVERTLWLARMHFDAEQCEPEAES